MEKIEWDDKFRIGVEAVDREHAKLFRIMTRLLDVPEDTKSSQNTYKEGIKYLEAYSMTHFSDEEAYMRSIRYGGYAHHKWIHDNFRDKTLVSLKRELEMSGYSRSSILRFMEVMSRWLTEHIMGEDQAIVGRAAAQRSADLSSRLPAISRAVNRASQDVFQIDTRLVSADYKGQNIGEGYYCRQYYGIEGGLGLQLLLGVEEPLFLRGSNQMQLLKLKKKEIPEESVLQTFWKLFRDLGRLFKAETYYRLGKDNLMDRDEFRTDFMKGYPCRLLFSTKSGYFVFCYRSWKAKSQKTTG
ncbi:MAG TPA: hypothetical protein DD414_07010 [Lachnospiraceae bacterium]|nr:hypothetical protein [Lachnospiraceae bacterium]